MTKVRVVIDTNVLVSTLINEASVSALVVSYAVTHFTILSTEDVWRELEAKLSSKKLSKYWNEESRILFLEDLATQTTFIQTTSTFTDCRDADDNKFLNLAVDGLAHLIISGDNDLRVLHPYRNIPILSPAEFLQKMNM